MRRAAVVGAVVVASLLVAVGPAASLVATTTLLTAPQIVGVGQTGVPAALEIINQNSEQVGAQVTEVRLAMSCASPAEADELCPGADPAAFALSPTAVGRADLQSTCGGRTWTLSPPDGSGSVVFNEPPDGTFFFLEKGSQCVMNFSFSVLRLPAFDADLSAPGVQTYANVRVRSISGEVTTSSTSSLLLTVRPGTPTISIQASPSVDIGGLISATATVTGPPGLPPPTGIVDFSVATFVEECWQTWVASAGRPIVNGSAQSSPFLPVLAGTYHWLVHYRGDANYAPITTPCTAPGNAVVVFPRRAVADFDGDGRTDPSVFRPSTGTWVIRTSSGETAGNFGFQGDVPVAGDYDGDRKADIAVFRPSTSTWFILNSSGQTIAGQFGIGGDVPVPADYDGDGKTDIGVFRPSSGMWFVAKSGGGVIEGAFGVAGDVPVPADYDGDGKADLAVFRPASGTWFIAKSSGGTVAGAHGTTGDVPVPADYDGDGYADIGVYRPGNGYWFVSKSGGGSIVGPFGAVGDVPVPGDYEQDRKADLAVYRSRDHGPLPNRPCICQAWFIQVGSAAEVIAIGQLGDLAVPLPPATRMLLYPSP